MRGALVGVAVASLLVTGLGAPPISAAVTVPAAVPTDPNPQIPPYCGLDATLVLDASGSIQSEGAVEKVRKAGNAFVKALKDTKSTARITQFASLSQELAPRTVVDAQSTSATGALTKAMAKYYNPIPPRPNDVTIYRFNGGDWTKPGNYSISNSSNQYTNWDQGMNDARQGAEAPEIILFVTDGDPTAFDLDRPGDPHYGNGKNVAMNTDQGTAATPTLDRAIQEANAAKGRNTRIMVVGVGPAVTKPGSASVQRMKDLSGPQVVQDKDLASVTNINQIDVALVQNFDNLASFLRQVVSEMCTPSLTIRKLAQTPGSSTYAPAAGWDMTLTPTVPGGFDWILPDTTAAASKTDATDAEGYAQFQWNPHNRDVISSALVAEQVRPGYTAGRPGAPDWVCEKRTPDDAAVEVVEGDFADPGDPRFTLSVGSRSIVTCSVYNSFDYDPRIELTKSVLDAVDMHGQPTVRGNGLGWNIRYRFEVTNPGNAPLSGVRVSDGKCDAAPTRVSGTGDRLEPGATWVFECPKFIHVPTSTAPIRIDNTATASGADPTGTTVSAQDSASVWVRTPAITLTKTPSATKIPAGGPVTYTYVLKNTGNDPVSDVTLSDPKCAPISAPSGPGAPTVLGVGDQWTYTCTTTLNQTTRNVADASGRWSGWTANGQNNGRVTAQADAIVDVTIPAYLTIVKTATPDGRQAFDYAASGSGLNPADTSFTLAPGMPGGKRSRTLVVEPVAGGTQYTVTEADVPGWELTGITCEGAQAYTPSLVDGKLLVTVKPGQTATCNFTNKQHGSLTIRKVTQPDGDPQQFGFTATGATPTSFTLTDEQEQVFADLAPGMAVTVTEGAVPGWILSDIHCDGGATVDVANRRISMTAANTEDVVCTFVNHKIPKATLTVVKAAEPPSGSFGFAVTGHPAFTLSPTAQDPAPSRTLTMSPPIGGATYQVAEAIPADWTLQDVTCRVTGRDGDTGPAIPGDPSTGVVDVPLKPGDSGVCTYRNARQSTLTIVKHVSLAGQTGLDTVFDFTKQVGAGTAETFTLRDFDTHGDQQVISGIVPGTTAVIDETVPTGWSLSGIACSTSAHQPVISGTQMSLEMGAGEDVTCAYTDAKEPSPKAVLEVVKIADPADGSGTFHFAVAQGGTPVEDFDLTPPDSASHTVELSPADLGTTYTLTEDALAGWDQQGLQCQIRGADGGTANGNSVDLELFPGDYATCTAVNVKRGSLTVVKQTDPQGAPQQFEFTATRGASPFTLSDGQTWVEHGIPADTDVTISESADEYWRLSGIVCSDGTAGNLADREVTVNIAAGEDVVCTFANTQLPPAHIVTVKVAEPEDGTAFPFTVDRQGTQIAAFDLTPPGEVSHVQAVRPPAGGASFTQAEGQLPAGWDSLGYRCVHVDADGIRTPETGGGRSVTQILRPGDTWVCGFGNREQARFTVAKVAPDSRGRLFDFDWDLTPGSFTLGDGDSRAASGLTTPKTVNVTESVPQFWTLESITCGGTATTVDSTDVNTGQARVTLGAGAGGTCTYVNTRTIYDPKMELVKTAAPAAVLPGGQVTYTYELTNVGDIALQPKGTKDEIITDDKCASVGFVSGSGDQLEPDRTWTFRCSTNLPQDTENTAEATMVPVNEPGKDLVVKDVAFVPVLEPAIAIDKSADQYVAYPDTEVQYTYRVTNPGEAGLADVKVTDDECDVLPGADNPEPGWDLNHNGLLDPVVEQQVWHCASTLSATTTNTGTATGTPTIPGDPPQTGPEISATDKVTVRVIDPALAITKTPSATGGVWKAGVYQVASGTPVTFTYDVTNTGDTALDLGAGVSDDRCAPVEYVKGDDGSGRIQSGQTWVYECKTTPVGNTGVITNVATVTGTEPVLGRQLTPTATARIQSHQSGIAITKSADQQVVELGTVVTYTYSVVNTGGTVLSDVAVTDDRCSPVKYVSGDTNHDGRLDLTETWVFNCAVALHQDTVNIATVTGTDPGGHKVTDETSHKVLVIGGELTPAISVKKTASATEVTKGTTVRYTYAVTNTGTMPLANVRVTDDKCSPVNYVDGDTNSDGLLTSATNGEGFPDEVWTFACSTPVLRDTTNTVTAIGSPWHAGQVVGKDVSATAQARVTVTAKPKLPLDVDSAKKCKGDTCKLVKDAKTNRYGKLRFRTLCRPVKSSASGQVRFCRVKVGKQGAVTVRIGGYPKVKVTVWIRATPKPKYAGQWRANTWKRTWILRRS